MAILRNRFLHFLMCAVVGFRSLCNVAEFLFIAASASAPESASSATTGAIADGGNNNNHNNLSALSPPPSSSSGGSHLRATTASAGANAAITAAAATAASDGADPLDHDHHSNHVPTSSDVPSFFIKKPGKFYIYDDPAISQSHVVNRLRMMGSPSWISRRDHTRADAWSEQMVLDKPKQHPMRTTIRDVVNRLRMMGNPSWTSRRDHTRADAWSEQMVLDKLKQHPMRTKIRDEASIFIIPTPIAELLGYGCEAEDCTWYDEAFRALQKQPSWNNGHDHVLISLHRLAFNPRFSRDVPSLSRNYRLLENVTVAHHYDPYGAMELSRSKSLEETGGYKPLFEIEQPITRAFSIGLSIGKAFDLQSPLDDGNNNRTKFLFYHSRSTPFAYNSTVYRMAPLKSDVLQGLQRGNSSSSISHDLDYDTWVNELARSQYCLVIRGDTPHSHSLLIAVRAGCIPIVVSDMYQDYAGPFKSTLSIEDFSIVIKEQDFMADPLGELLAVKNLPESQVQEKREKLAEAQKIFPDHPDSILVEAFIKEAERSQSQTPPHLIDRQPIHALESSAIISNKNYGYRYPSSMIHPPFPSQSKSKIVLGALSFSLNFWKRHAVRVTWGQNQPVFFVVAGPFEQIADEFYMYGDLLWLDIPENYYEGLTPKTQVFLHAVEKHVVGYDYALKTDDDAYLGMDVVDRILSKYKPDYWGSCVSKERWRHPHRDTSDKYYVSKETFAGNLFPVWARGFAYTLSPKFLKCATSKFADIPFMSMEDVATGIIAAECEVECRKDEWDWWSGDDKGEQTPIVALHYEEYKTAQFMSVTHWNELRKRGITG